MRIGDEKPKRERKNFRVLEMEVRVAERFEYGSKRSLRIRGVRFREREQLDMCDKHRIESNMTNTHAAVIQKANLEMLVVGS